MLVNHDNSALEDARRTFVSGVNVYQTQTFNFSIEANCFNEPQRIETAIQTVKSPLHELYFNFFYSDKHTRKLIKKNYLLI